MKNNSFVQDIEPFYNLIGKLHFHELEVCITATQDVYLDGWIGAVLRNNLLFAAEKVKISGTLSLRQIIEIIPVQENHTLYNELKNGFPRGFVLSPISHQTTVSSSRLSAGETVRFSLLLFGHFANYYPEFVKAIQEMCNRGIGKQISPFLLTGLYERSSTNIVYPLLNQQLQPDPLQHKIQLSDFTNQKFNESEKEITIRYTTPVNLYSNTFATRSPQSYQDRQNGFPGFYQLIRSAASRISKLAALYTYPENKEYYTAAKANIESFTQYAVSVLLTSAQIQQAELYSSPKKGTNKRLRFTGYTGQLTVNGYFNYYLPLLLFAQHIGVGYNIVYGLGRYEIVKHKNPAL